MVQTLTGAGLLSLLLATGCSLTFYGLKEVQDEPRPALAAARCPDGTRREDTALAAARSRPVATRTPARQARSTAPQPAPAPPDASAQPAPADTSPEAPSPSIAAGP